MPAAAVIPAPIAYIKVVAVKKLVVEFQALVDRSASRRALFRLGLPFLVSLACRLFGVQVSGQDFYFEKIRVFKAGLCPNILAWNNRIGRCGPILLVSRIRRND